MDDAYQACRKRAKLRAYLARDIFYRPIFDLQHDTNTARYAVYAMNFLPDVHFPADAVHWRDFNADAFCLVQCIVSAAHVLQEAATAPEPPRRRPSATPPPPPIPKIGPNGVRLVIETPPARDAPHRARFVRLALYVSLPPDVAATPPQSRRRGAREDRDNGNEDDNQREDTSRSATANDIPPPYLAHALLHVFHASRTTFQQARRKVNTQRRSSREEVLDEEDVSQIPFSHAHCMIHTANDFITRVVRPYMQPGIAAMSPDHPCVNDMCTPQRITAGLTWIDSRAIANENADLSSTDTAFITRESGVCPDDLFAGGLALAVYCTPHMVPTAYCQPSVYGYTLRAPQSGESELYRHVLTLGEDGHGNDVDISSLPLPAMARRLDVMLSTAVGMGTSVAGMPRWPSPGLTWYVGREYVRTELFAMLPLPHAMTDDITRLTRLARVRILDDIPPGGQSVLPPAGVDDYMLAAEAVRQSVSTNVALRAPGDDNMASIIASIFVVNDALRAHVAAERVMIWQRERGVVIRAMQTVCDATHAKHLLFRETESDHVELASVTCDTSGPLDWLVARMTSDDIQNVPTHIREAYANSVVLPSVAANALLNTVPHDAVEFGRLLTDMRGGVPPEESDVERQRRWQRMIASEIDPIPDEQIQLDDLLALRGHHFTQLRMLQIQNSEIAAALSATMDDDHHKTFAREFAKTIWETRVTQANATLNCMRKSTRVSQGLKDARQWLTKHCMPRPYDAHGDANYKMYPITDGRPFSQYEIITTALLVSTQRLSPSSFPVVHNMYYGKCDAHGYEVNRIDAAMNYGLFGRKAVGKTFGVRAAADTSVPGIAETVSHKTGQADNVTGNFCNKLYIYDEIRPGQICRPSGKTDPGMMDTQSMLKEILTSFKSSTKSIRIDKKTKERSQVSSFALHHNVRFVTSNVSEAQLEEAIARRFICFTRAPSRYDDSGRVKQHDTRLTAFANPTATRRGLFMLRNHDSGVIHMETLIKAGVIPDVNVDGANMILRAVADVLRDEYNMDVGQGEYAFIIRKARAKCLMFASWFGMFSPVAHYEMSQPNAALRWDGPALMQWVAPALHVTQDQLISAVSGLCLMFHPEPLGRVFYLMARDALRIRDPAQWRFPRIFDARARPDAAGRQPTVYNLDYLILGTGSLTKACQVLADMNYDYEYRPEDLCAVLGPLMKRCVDTIPLQPLEGDSATTDLPAPMALRRDPNAPTRSIPIITTFNETGRGNTKYVAVAIAFLEKRFGFDICDMDSCTRVFEQDRRSLVRDVKTEEVDDALIHDLAYCGRHTHAVYDAILTVLQRRVFGTWPGVDLVPPPPPCMRDFITHSPVPPVRIKETRGNNVATRVLESAGTLQMLHVPEVGEDEDEEPFMFENHTRKTPAMRAIDTLVEYYEHVDDDTDGDTGPSRAVTRETLYENTHVVTSSKYETDWIFAREHWNALACPNYEATTRLLLQHYPRLQQIIDVEGILPITYPPLMYLAIDLIMREERHAHPEYPPYVAYPESNIRTMLDEGVKTLHIRMGETVNRPVRDIADMLDNRVIAGVAFTQPNPRNVSMFVSPPTSPRPSPAARTARLRANNVARRDADMVPSERFARRVRPRVTENEADNAIDNDMDAMDISGDDA